MQPRVLVLEDDPEIGDLLFATLTAAGYNAELVATALDARRRIEASSYSLLIADWRLPGGDGLVVANRAADLGIKTIVISGYLFEITGADTRHEYLLKPFMPDELIRVVDHQIRKPVK